MVYRVETIICSKCGKKFRVNVGGVANVNVIRAAMKICPACQNKMLIGDIRNIVDWAHNIKKKKK